MTNKKKSLPSFATAGLFSACRKFCGRYATQRLPNLMDRKRRSNARRGQMTSAVTRPTPAPVRPTARAAAVDRSSTRPRMNGPRSLTVTTTLRPPWVTLSLVPNGSERWAAGHGVLIEALARGGLAAGFVAVKGGHPREAASGARRRGDRGIGVAPGTRRKRRRVAGVMGMMVVAVMMMVMPGFGRGFGDAPTDQKSCGEKS